MPSYVIRKTITDTTAENIKSKMIEFNYNNSKYKLINYICDIYPIKYEKNKQILVFYLDNNLMKWELYNYEYIEIPRNKTNYVYIIHLSNLIINEGTVPISVKLKKTSN